MSRPSIKQLGPFTVEHRFFARFVRLANFSRGFTNIFICFISGTVFTAVADSPTQVVNSLSAHPNICTNTHITGNTNCARIKLLLSYVLL